MTLSKKILSLENLIAQADRRNPSVSKRGVDWHIAHSLKVIEEVYGAIEKSDPEAYQRRANLAKFFFLTFQYIPRGRAEAPEVVRLQDKEALDPKNLEKKVQTSQDIAEKIKQLHKHKHFKHPLLGYMNLTESIRFLEIHTNHHLKIIRDIINSSTDN